MYSEKSKFKGEKTFKNEISQNSLFKSYRCISNAPRMDNKYIIKMDNSFLTSKFKKTSLKSLYNQETFLKVNKNKGGI